MHTIQLNKKDHSIKVVNRTNTVGLKVMMPTITLHQTGLRGPTGETGATGPQGAQGEQGEPGTPGDDSDKNYFVNFTNQSTVTIVHNLGKYPSVSVIDSAGDEVEGEVDYLDINTVEVRFTGSFTGSASLN